MLLQAEYMRDRIVAAAARYELATVYRALLNNLTVNKDAYVEGKSSSTIPTEHIDCDPATILRNTAPNHATPWTVGKVSEAAQSLRNTDGPLAFLASAKTVHGLWHHKDRSTDKRHPRSDQFRFLSSHISDHGMNSVRDEVGNLWILAGEIPCAIDGASQGIRVTGDDSIAVFEEFVFDPNSVIFTTNEFSQKLIVKVERNEKDSSLAFSASMTIGAEVINPLGAVRVINSIAIPRKRD